MPSDSGIWQGSLFYRNPLNFMIILDSSCLLFGPQALRVILFFFGFVFLSNFPYSNSQHILLDLSYTSRTYSTAAT